MFPEEEVPGVEGGRRGRGKSFLIVIVIPIYKLDYNKVKGLNIISSAFLV